MSELNIKKIKEKEKELVYYPDWIPCILFMFISMYDRNNFLNAQGSYDRIEKENIEYRNNMKQSPDGYAYEMKRLKEWINEHPQFKDLII